MHLNNKILPIIAGLILVLGVGIGVDKGSTAQITQATIISDLTLVRATQTVPPSAAQTIYNTLELKPFDLDCALNLSVKSLRGARVKLAVTAPCHKNKTITIKHASLRFSEIVDDNGMITIIIPVLSDPATIEVSFADGTFKSISAPAKDLSSLQ